MIKVVISEEHDCDKGAVVVMHSFAKDFESLASTKFKKSDIYIVVHGNTSNNGYYVDCTLLNDNKYDSNFYSIEYDIKKLAAKHQCDCRFDDRTNVFFRFD